MKVKSSVGGNQGRAFEVESTRRAYLIGAQSLGKKIHLPNAHKCSEILHCTKHSEILTLDHGINVAAAVLVQM